MGYGATLALVIAVSSAPAFAGDRAPAARHPFESCLTARALELERSGTAVDEVLAAAARSCRDAKGELSDAAASEIASRTRLAVMQQRSNALNTRRRG